MNIGNGLVEISALTTIIGSSRAADLAVGNRGAAGMVWGSITTFGNSSVIKACAGAVLPGWLRHILGLKTRAADEAVGMDLPLFGGTRFSQAVRSSESFGPLGVVSESDGLDVDAEHGILLSEPSVLKYRDVLAFNRTMSVMVEGLASTPAGHPLEIYMPHHYDCFPDHNLAFQLTALGLSLLKVAEIYYLFSYGGHMLGFLSAIPFAFSFLVAVIIEIQDIFASRRPVSVDGHVDIVVRSPPTVKQPGGLRKVVLGALKNPKTTIWWKAYYSINATLQIVSLFIYYQLFGQEQMDIVMVWAGFQVAWVTLRAFIFHFTNLTAPMIHRRMRKYELADLSPPMQLRVLNLVAAVGIYQTHMHPRNIRNYKDDTFSAVKINKLLATTNIIHETYELPKECTAGSYFHIDIVAVAGDTIFSAATWMAGVELSPMDVYDSCVVVLSVPSVQASGSRAQPPRTITIPAARVFSVTNMQEVTDSEGRRPVFVPRGAGHGKLAGHRLEWIYWIPCGSGLWLHFWSQNQTVLGHMEAKIVSDKDVSAMLGAGTWNIGFKDVENVKSVVDVSREVLKCLLAFVDVSSNL